MVGKRGQFFLVKNNRITIFPEKNRRGQIWVETVIYTLIGLAIIGILLSLVTPAIEEKKQEILIKKRVEIRETMDGKKQSTLKGF